jgi:hypothetical protein
MKSKMYAGIQQLAHGAMDVQSDFTRELIAVGVPAEHAITAGNHLAKQGFNQRLEEAMNNASASAMTASLAKMGAHSIQ